MEFEAIEAVFEQVVRYAILFMEMIGVVVMLVTAVKAVIGLLKHDGGVRIALPEGIALALEFKLGGEVLHTLIVRSTDELMMLGAVVLLRAAITVLIQWGIKRERTRLDEERTAARPAELAEHPAFAGKRKLDASGHSHAHSAQEKLRQAAWKRHA